MRKTVRVLALGVLALAAACSDSSGPGGTTITTQQRQVLSNALTDIDATAGLGVGVYGALALQFTNQVGSLGAGSAALMSGAVRDAINASLQGVRATSYEGAVGIQVIVNDAQFPGTFTAVVAWDGLNAQAETVDEVLFAGAFTETATPVGNGTYSFASETDPYALGMYYTRSTASVYVATSGNFVLSGSSFPGSGTDCSAQQITCNYRVGSMSGSVAFASDKVAGAGPATYAQSQVTFTNLPTVRITLSGFIS